MIDARPAVSPASSTTAAGPGAEVSRRPEGRVLGVDDRLGDDRDRQPRHAGVAKLIGQPVAAGQLSAVEAVVDIDLAAASDRLPCARWETDGGRVLA